MILTYKVKHGLQLDPSLFMKAIAVAHFALKNGFCSTAVVKHLGLKSAIANQILRKYDNRKDSKRIKQIDDRKVKLTIPGQISYLDKGSKILRLPVVKGSFNVWFDCIPIVKVNQVELDREWAYVCVTLPDVPMKVSAGFLGVDLNSTSHSVVIADPRSGRVWKLGKQVPHLKRKYRNIRSRLQSAGRYRELRRVKGREQRKTNHVLRNVAKEGVRIAEERQLGVKLEELTGIRKNCTTRGHRTKNHVLNSWPFARMRTFIEQRAKKLGVECVMIDPARTSSTCSRCGDVDKKSRDGKSFCCVACGHVEHADVNAAFNIASRPKLDPAEKEIRKRGHLKSSGGAGDEGPPTSKPYSLVL